MKNLVFAFALLCSSSLVAQFSFNANGTGIQSPTNTASGTYSIAMGSSVQASGGYSTVIGTQSVATDIGSIAIGGGVNSDVHETLATLKISLDATDFANTSTLDVANTTGTADDSEFADS